MNRSCSDSLPGRIEDVPNENQAISGQQDFNKQRNMILRLELYFFKLRMLNAVIKNLAKGENNDANFQSLKGFQSGYWSQSIREGLSNHCTEVWLRQAK